LEKRPEMANGEILYCRDKAKFKIQSLRFKVGRNDWKGRYAA